MKPSELAAKMYDDFRFGGSHKSYTDEEIMAALNFNRGMINFFVKTGNNVLICGLTDLETQLLTVLRGRGRNV